MVNKTLTLDKIKKYFHLNGNRELADFLGVTKQTISNWYNRKSFDYDVIINKCLSVDKNIDLRWLLTETEDNNDNKHENQIESCENIGRGISYIEKNYESRRMFIDPILMACKYIHAEETYNICEDIRNILDYAKDACLIYKLEEFHTALKMGKISKADVENRLQALISEDKKLYDVIEPYHRELKAMSGLLMLQLYQDRDEEIYKELSQKKNM